MLEASGRVRTTVRARDAELLDDNAAAGIGL
jgi:hypothetical protein